MYRIDFFKRYDMYGDWSVMYGTYRAKLIIIGRRLMWLTAYLTIFYGGHDVEFGIGEMMAHMTLNKTARVLGYEGIVVIEGVV